jgi:hypothetical protein
MWKQTGGLEIDEAVTRKPFNRETTSPLFRPLSFFSATAWEPGRKERKEAKSSDPAPPSSQTSGFTEANGRFIVNGVRLQPDECDATKTTVARRDPQARVFPFGSRLDAGARGGDIDLPLTSDGRNRADLRQTRPDLQDRLRRTSAGAVSLVLLVAVALTGIVRAGEPPDNIDATVAQFFRPFQRELATLSPDGRHVALTEEVRPGQASIVVVNLDDHSARSFHVGALAQHAVLQMQWVSATRLVFTTTSRAVGLLDLGEPEVRALLLNRDLDVYQPTPTLGPRALDGIVTPDMPAEANTGSPAFAADRHRVTLSEALAQARASGDLFGHDSKRGAGRALRPFLLGPTPGTDSKILVEVRGDADLFAYAHGEQGRIVLPGNVFLSEPGVPPPTSINDVRGVPGNFAEYASYDVDFPSPPLVVLEVDLAKGGTKEVALSRDWRRTWTDQQGRLRLALDQDGKRLRYLYRGADEKKWLPLDRLVKAAAPLNFNVGADNLLGPRAVPLGFDAAAKFLFIATNVGRDTFSLRALDLAKGQLENFEVGHQYFDLIEPTALTVADVLRFDPRTRELAGVRLISGWRHNGWTSGNGTRPGPVSSWTPPARTIPAVSSCSMARPAN